MNTRSFGALAACLAGLAVLLGGLVTALELPTPVEVAMIVGALVLLASAGGLIGVAISTQKKPRD